MLLRSQTTCGTPRWTHCLLRTVGSLQALQSKNSSRLLINGVSCLHGERIDLRSTSRSLSRNQEFHGRSLAFLLVPAASSVKKECGEVTCMRIHPRHCISVASHCPPGPALYSTGKTDIVRALCIPATQPSRFAGNQLHAHRGEGENVYIATNFMQPFLNL